MGKRFLGLAVLAALVVACESSSEPVATATGGVMAVDPAVDPAVAEALAACGNTDATGDGICANGFRCLDAAAGLGSPVPLNSCSCPATGQPPTCDLLNAASCAAFPGTNCQDPGVAAGLPFATGLSFCLGTPALCTPPVPVGTGGVLATGGDMAMGGAMPATGGEIPATGGDVTTGGVAMTGGQVAGSGGVAAATCPPGFMCGQSALVPGQNLCLDPASPASMIGVTAPPTCATPGDPSGCDAVLPGSSACLENPIVDLQGFVAAVCIKQCTP